MSRYLLSLSRVDCRRLTGLVTGHNTCARHMARMGIVDSPVCVSCLEEEDTTEHYICYCPAFSRTRQRILAGDVLSMESVHRLSLPDILRFIKETGKF